MKDEYIVLTPIGLAAAVIVGVLVGTTVHAVDASHVAVTMAIACLLAVHVRNDARQPIANGKYRRRFLIWRKEREIEQTIAPGADEDARSALH